MSLTLAPHRLRRLRWQAHAGDTSQALALRSLLREQGDGLHQHLEQALDEAAATLGLPPDVVVHIPRLELHLPAPPLPTAPRPSAEQAAAWSLWMTQLQAALVRQLQQAVPSSTRVSAASTQAVKPIPAQARMDLLQYLHSGWPGWALAGLQDNTQPLQVAAAALADEWAADDSQGLTPAALQRFWAWAGIQPDTQVTHALGVFARWLALLPAARRARWVQARPAEHLPLQLVGAGAATRLALLVQWQAQARQSLWAQAMWLAWPEHSTAQDPWQTALVQSDGPDAQAPAALGRLRVALKAAMPRAASRAGQVVEGTPAPALTPAPADATHRAEPPTPSTESLADHLVVPLAGLVLLHPYLARLLQGLQLHSGQPGEALSPAVLPRALALLHALACDTGPAAALELDLPFVKLLLGLPPTHGLDVPPAQLDEADTAEVQALLQAVRQHWPALRSTSVQALRISFLQRRGLLRRAADGQGWQLQVQSEAFDLLLASLPWSLSWVKLPWMPEPLAVDWQVPT